MVFFLNEKCFRNCKMKKETTFWIRIFHKRRPRKVWMFDPSPCQDICMNKNSLETVKYWIFNIQIFHIQFMKKSLESKIFFHQFFIELESFKIWVFCQNKLVFSETIWETFTKKTFRLLWKRKDHLLNFSWANFCTKSSRNHLKYSLFNFVEWNLFI